jgi:Tfp pilus assembly protein PilF
MSAVIHYCQKCLSPNPLGQDFCARCGTRMMIIVEPPTARYEALDSGQTNEEHLLERISSLENRLSRLTGRLDQGLDLLLRQAQNSYFDRAMVKALVALLSEDGIVEGERLERVWNDRCQKDAEEQEESARREELRVRILSGYCGQNRGVFEQFINEGFLFIEDEQPARGIRSLQRAADMARDNAPLLSFVGEHFFKAGKNRRAQDYLARAYAIVPGDIRLTLLLGLTCADEGETERAKDLLNNATHLGISSFAAHYGLGRLFVAEENWQNALKEFKRALVIKPSPEAHYALGCLYYQLSRDSLATRHLKKAVEMDAGYAEAFYVLALIYQRAGRENLAREAFAKSDTAETPAKRNHKRMPTGDTNVAPLFQLSSSKPLRLITGSDRRLAEALRLDALNTVAPVDS